MASDGSQSESVVHAAAQFATTHWSTVLRAGAEESAQSQAALDKLCRQYWYPVYAHIRHRGIAVEDARDLTQAFFFEFLQKGGVGKADARRGRFRTYLLTCVDHFVADAHDRQSAVRRGGKVDFMSLDDPATELRFQSDLATCRTPREAFDRNWAAALLEAVLGQLEAESCAAGKERLFEALRSSLMQEGLEETYAGIAARLGTSEAAIKMAALRLRRRFAELVRLEIGRTVVDPAEVEAELNDLMTAFDQ
jgi:RNA polymerase sigma factor (sigma-70 family)